MKKRAPRRGRRSGFLSKRGEARLLLALMICAPTLALGGAHSLSVPWLLLWVTVCAAIMRLRGFGRISAPALGAIAIAAYSAAQALPLPAGLVEVVNPGSADVWRLAADNLGQSPSSMSLSIDPSASLLEAMKWSAVACVLISVAGVTRRLDVQPLIEVVFVSALLLSTVTIAHALVGAERIYGWYTPIAQLDRWATSPFINPNNLGGYCNLGLFSGLALVWRSKSPTSRWMVGFLSVALVLSVVLSGSRGAVGVLVLGLLAVGGLVLSSRQVGSRRSRRLMRRTYVFALLTVALCSLLVLNDGVRAELGDESWHKLRIPVWGAPLLMQFLYTGTGAGAFEAAVGPIQTSYFQGFISHPENFAFAWLTEWGALVGIVILGMFSWILIWPVIRLRDQRDLVVWGIGAWALSVQNLVDVAFTLPASLLGLAVVVGGLWGATPSRAAVRRRPSKLRRVPVWMSLAVSGAFAVLGVLVQPRVALEERVELHERWLRSAERPDERELLGRDVRAALARHPGDPYLPVLIALTDESSDAAHLRWYGYALERAPRRSLTHLLLAGALGRVGAAKQGLIHVRLAVKYHPDLADQAARIAIQLSERENDLIGAAPEGPVGAHFLVSCAKRLPAREETRRALMREALSLDPAHVEARVLLALELVSPMRNTCDQGELCLEQAQVHIDWIKNSESSHPRAAEALAHEILFKQGAKPAIDFLVSHCDRSEVTCLELALTLAVEATLPIGEINRQMLLSFCPGGERCARAHEKLAGAYQTLGLGPKALSHLHEMAKVRENFPSWIALATAAGVAGDRIWLAQGLERASVLSRGQPEREKQLEALRQRFKSRPAP